VPLALGILTGSLVLYFALDSGQNQEIAQTVKAGAEGARSQITVRMEARVRSLVRMAQRWEFSGPPARPAWEDDAANYVHDFPDLQALEWIDATHLVRWIVPLAGNEDKLNLDLTREERRRTAITEAEREHQPVITRVVTLFHGGLGFVLYVPIFLHGQPDGFIAAVFNGQACLGRYLPAAVATGNAITVSEGGRPFFQRDAGAPATREDWDIAEKIELHGATWELRMWPTPALAARLASPLPGFVLCGGILGALLLAAVCFYAQRSSRQASETARANVALQAALDKVRTLEGLLPICCCCKRVREDSGYWSQIDTYLGEHTRASLSHGYCPECAAKTYKEFGIDIPDDIQAAVAARNYE
jgi:sensor domain CHASE-containing protein